MTIHMEFIPGYGYRWDDGSQVYQEQQLLPSGWCIGHTNYGKPWAFSATELRVESCSEGFWVMDRLGSYHKHPFRSADAAIAYMAKITGEQAL